MAISEKKLPVEVPSPDPAKTLSSSQAAKNANAYNEEGKGEKPESYADVDLDDLPVIVAEVPSTNGHRNGKSGSIFPPGHRTLVAESETVAPEVKWEPEHRHYHDKVWGVLYAVAWIAFLACGLTLVSQSHARYDWQTVSVDDVNSNNVSLRIVSDYYQADAQQCCANKQVFLEENPSYTSNSGWDLCSELTLDTAGRRRGLRHLQFEDEEETNTATDDYYSGDDFFGWSNHSQSKFEAGDGMFDAFLDAPGIIITLCLLALSCALLWVVLLKFFATPIVFATEAIKVGFFLYLFVTGLIERTTGAAVVALLCAIGIVAWDVYTYKQLIFAGKVLSHAASSFKENAAMFCAFVPILGLYALHAYLFVLFYSKSFEVTNVEHVKDCFTSTSASYPVGSSGSSSGGSYCTSACRYVAPSYTTGMVVYISLAYLWSVLLFYTMRLSIIATIVGSWHFHPDRKPSIVRAVVNTCTTSMGTLAAASLVQTIAEKLNRMLLSESMWKHCFNPVFWIIMPLYCAFGYCIRMFIVMLTKFSVILHVFTGNSWWGSAKSVFKIMKRHFKGGFVTEYASTNVLMLGSYVFSISIYFIAWVWFDAEFNTETFVGVSDSSILVVVWLFFALFNIWYPVLGVYLLIVLNRLLSKWEILDPALWVTPFAATFVGCIAMMFFTYLAGIFLDTVDVLFLCFAIDRDNNVDMSENEFAKLVKEGVPGVLETPDLDGATLPSDEEEPSSNFADIPIVEVTEVEPIPAIETALATK